MSTTPVAVAVLSRLVSTYVDAGSSLLRCITRGFGLPVTFVDSRREGTLSYISQRSLLERTEKKNSPSPYPLGLLGRHAAPSPRLPGARLALLMRSVWAVVQRSA